MTPNPYYSFTFFLILILSYYYFAWRTHVLYRQALEHNDKNAIPLRYFFWSFFWMGTFFIFHWTPLLAFYVGGPYAEYSWFQISHPWSHLLGHIFMHLSFAYTALIGAYFSWPKLKPYVFSWVFFWGILLGTPITIRYPQVTTIIGPIMLGGDSPIVGMLTALGALGMLFAGIVFLYQAIKSKDKVFRLRALLLGLGFIVFFIAGPLNDSAGTYQAVVIANMLVVLSVLLIAAGILFRKGELVTPANTTPYMS